jgi:type II secretion system protein C
VALALVLALVAPAAPAQVELVGLVLAARPERSAAVLRAGDRARAAAIGETAFGMRVLEVAPGRVAVERDGQRLELRLALAPEPAQAAARSPQPATRAAEPPGARALGRAEVEGRLSAEIPRILAETAVAPVYDEGQVVGLALTRMPEGTLLSDAGLRPGDVLLRINDVPIDGMATLIGLWPRLQGASDLHAVVLRNGQPLSLSLTLR